MPVKLKHFSCRVKFRRRCFIQFLKCLCYSNKYEEGQWDNLVAKSGYASLVLYFNKTRRTAAEEKKLAQHTANYAFVSVNRITDSKSVGRRCLLWTLVSHPTLQTVVVATDIWCT